MRVHTPLHRCWRHKQPRFPANRASRQTGQTGVFVVKRRCTAWRAPREKDLLPYRRKRQLNILLFTAVCGVLI